MRVTVKKPDLVTALSIANRAVSSKPALPILERMLFQVSGDKATISTTNLEISVITEVPLLTVEGPFTAAIPSGLFTDLINAISDDEITLDYDPDRHNLNVKSKKSVNNVKCDNADDLVHLSESAYSEFGEVSFTIHNDIFRQAVEQISVSAAKPDHPNATIRGLLLETVGEDNTRIVLVGIDGFRWGVKYIDVATKLPFSTILPALLLQEISKIATGGFIDVSVGETATLFRCAGSMARISAIDGKFVDYRRLNPVPSTDENNIRLSTPEFQRAVKHAKIFADDNKIRLSFGPLFSSVSAANDQSGNGNVDIVAPSVLDTVIIVNGDFLSDFLTSAPQSEVVLSITGPTSPLTFRMGDQLDPGAFFHCIMPIAPKAG